jgi:transcriptional repressor NrdR
VRCPFCSSDSSRVVDSRLTESGEVRRRRECGECENRFTTYERPEEAPVTVLKRDGGRERFDRQKLLRGLGRAANKRPVSDEQLEAVADSIASEVRRGGPEADASWIGELSLRGLASVDPVSAIQFASVYRKFEDLDELEEEVRRLKRQIGPGPSDPESSIGLSPSGGEGESAETRREHVRQP